MGMIQQTVKRGATAGMAIVLAMGSGAVLADDAELEAQIRQLATKLEALQRQLDAKTPSAAPATDVVTKGDVPGSFKIPGTETSVKIGGFAALDMIKDFNGGGMGGTVGFMPLIPLDGSAAQTREGQFTLTARRSRFHITTLTPTSMGALKTYLESDFYGAGGNELASNSSAMRLRLAYAELGPWTFGQAYTSFVDFGTYPEILDFSGGHGLAGPQRQGLVKYSTRSGANEYSLSIENPESDISTNAPVTFSAGSGPVSTISVDKRPDIAAKYATSGSWGRLAVSGVVRYITLNNTGGAAINGFTGQDSVTGGGIVISGKLMTVGDDHLNFTLLGGPGIGRYILGGISGVGLSTTAVVNNNRLEAVKSWGGNISYRHFWTPKLRSTASYGVVRSDNPHPALPTTAISRADGLFLNLMWSPTPVTNFGIELVHGRAKNDTTPTATTSNEGSSNRVAVSMLYTF